MEKLRQNKIIKLSVRVDEDLRVKYHNFCKDNGYSLSKRIRFYMEKDMDGKLEIKR